MKSVLLFAFSWGLVVGCAAPPSPQAGAPASTEPAVEMSPDHAGKRVRLLLKNGSQALIGKVVQVDRPRDSATLETDYGSQISFRPSQIAVLEVLSSEDHSQHEAARDEAPEVTRFSHVSQKGGADGPMDADSVRLIAVDFRYEHRIGECLQDMAETLQNSPSTVLFNDGASTLRLRVPIPTDENASLVPFSWHAHGMGKEGADRIFVQDGDGDIVIEMKDLQEAKRLVLVGTPYRVENTLSGIRAVAPPRMVAIDLVEAEKAAAVLENNPAIVSSCKTALGKLYVAAQPENESEMLLSLYDPERVNAPLMADARFSVQDALLYPAWTLEARDEGGKLWQKLGAWPVPRFLSFETPETTHIALEIAEERIGEFPAPAQAIVRAPETALVKAELDIRYAGLIPGVPYRMILAHGAPHDVEKKTLFNPAVKEPKPERTYESVAVDLSKAPAEAFPAQVFVWYQLSAAWNMTGGFMSGAPPMRPPARKTAPKRRLAIWPAASPGLRFITFSGPKPAEGGSGGAVSAALPSTLAAQGMGGETIGTGGPYVPFSPSVAVSPVVDNRISGKAPVASSHAAPVLTSDPVSASTAKAGANARAIAIANGGMVGGGCGKPEEPPKPDRGEKPPNGRNVPRDSAKGPGKKPPAKPDVITEDPLHPRIGPKLPPAWMLQSAMGWK